MLCESMSLFWHNPLRLYSCFTGGELKHRNLMTHPETKSSDPTNHHMLFPPPMNTQYALIAEWQLSSHTFQLIIFYIFRYKSTSISVCIFPSFLNSLKEQIFPSSYNILETSIMLSSYTIARHSISPILFCFIVVYMFILKKKTKKKTLLIHLFLIPFSDHVTFMCMTPLDHCMVWKAAVGFEGHVKCFIFSTLIPLLPIILC